MSGKAKASGAVMALLLTFSLVLSACGGSTGSQATATSKPGAVAGKTAAPTQGAVGKTAAPQAGKTATSSGGDSWSKLLDNVVELAPVRIEGLTENFAGEEVTSRTRWTLEIDSKGNRRVTLTGEDESDVIEILGVDGKGYMGGGGQYTEMPNADLSSFSFIAMFGGAALLAFNDLSDAKKLGSESVNGFTADKYEASIGLGALGGAGVFAKIKGAELDYQGFAWIEPKTGALVKATAEWKSKASGDAEVEGYRMTYDATKAEVAPIEVPNK